MPFFTAAAVFQGAYFFGLASVKAPFISDFCNKFVPKPLQHVIEMGFFVAAMAVGINLGLPLPYSDVLSNLSLNLIILIPLQGISVITAEYTKRQAAKQAAYFSSTDDDMMDEDKPTISQKKSDLNKKQGLSNR